MQYTNFVTKSSVSNSSSQIGPANKKSFDMLSHFEKFEEKDIDKRKEEMAKMSQPQVSAVLKKLKEKGKIKTEYDKQAKRTKILPTL